MSTTTPPEPAGRLTIETLGRFTVRRDGEILPDTAWTRLRARELLQYFVTRRFQLTSRERIVDDLWPDLPLSRAGRDFKVALNALYAALEPDRPPRTPCRYVQRQGTSYGLAADAGIDLDTVAFEAGLRAAERLHAAGDRDGAIAGYEAALARYAGDFLPDAVYQDWTVLQRERLALQFRGGAAALAALLIDAGRPVAATQWCHRLLEQDPYWEAAYRLLMRCHAAQGNRPLVVQTYRRLERRLRDDLGLEPMAETVGVYQRLRER